MTDIKSADDLIDEGPDAPVARGSDKRKAQQAKLFEPTIVRRAALDSFKKLNPRTLARNPVMMIVEIGSIVTTIVFFRDLFQGVEGSQSLFTGLVTAWLWFTVLFANLAEAMAEGRGKAQADSLRKARSDTTAF